MPDFHLPYLIDYSRLVIDDIAIFSVAILTAILVSAEGQGFVATLLGDARENPKDRMHFNVFMHMSLLGTLSFFVAGFGWPKEIDIDKTKFKHPRLYLILSRLSGPVANLLMANIAASISWILGRYGVVDRVFATIVVVNVTMAVYNLLIVPPLPGAALIFAFIPENGMYQNVRKILYRLGPFVIVVTFLAARLIGWTGISSVFSPAVRVVTRVILNF